MAVVQLDDIDLFTFHYRLLGLCLRVELLIDFYAKHPLLFDVKSSDYHNRVKRRTAFQKIADELRTTGVQSDFNSNHRRNIIMSLYLAAVNC